MVKIDNDYFEAFRLNWDTDYFGIKSAKVILKKNLNEDSKKNILNFIKDYEFTTIINKNNNKNNNYWLGNETRAFLTDINIRLEKVVISAPKILESKCLINDYKKREDGIIKIARDSFIYSRFFNDQFLENNKKNEIYVTWVKNSFNKKGKYFITHSQNKSVDGFILFNIDSNELNSTIELIAVDKNIQKKGIGTSMINLMENQLIKKGIKRIIVGTQAENFTAINFYRTNGFNFLDCNTVYHHWQNHKYKSNINEN